MNALGEFLRARREPVSPKDVGIEAGAALGGHLPPRAGQHRDWEALTEEGVAFPRANTGTDLSHPRLVELVAELSTASEHFHTLLVTFHAPPDSPDAERLAMPTPEPTGTP